MFLWRSNRNFQFLSILDCCLVSFFVVVSYGAENVPAFFEAVAKGQKVDFESVQGPFIEFAKDCVAKHPNACAFLLECNEMPMMADGIRCATGLPVYDKITCCNFFMSGVLDNPRFGLNDWQKSFDGFFFQQNFKFYSHC